mgnify:CR=1 FL=1
MGGGKSSNLPGLASREAFANSTKPDVVDHPSHYNAFGPMDDDGTARFEPIKVIEAWGLGPEFCIGNALKYIARAPHKGRPIEDLKKAKWYLMRAASCINRSGDACVIPDMTDEAGWADVCDGWGLTHHLRNAVLNIWNGCPTAAADCVQREIDRMADCVRKELEK